MRIAVILPCYNEAVAIAKVVADFRAALPDAVIYVYDNNSADRTREIAAAAGAVVRRERQQGKGYVVARAFADVEADIYVMVDGDDTYDAATAPAMVAMLLDERLDMVTGTRVTDIVAAYRPGLDTAALARLPFPETDPIACRTIGTTSSETTTRDLILFWCATTWDAAHVRANLLRAVSWAKRHDVTLLAGEFGASIALNAPARLAWLSLVRETCAENGIGWALWGYDDVMGFNIRRPPENKPRLDRSVLKALGLP